MTLTLLFLAAFAAIILWQCKYTYNGQDAFSSHSMLSLKGIAAIIVVMVHILPPYQNPVQDAVGSFAYIAVTMFFFASSFGMEYSVTKKGMQYLHDYWRGRLSALLIPMFLVNILAFASAWLRGVSNPYHNLYVVNNYVIILLEYCLLFYIIRLIQLKLHVKQLVGDIILSIAVIASSLLCYKYSNTEIMGLGWPFERFGLIWGLLAFRFKEKIQQLIFRHYFPLLALSFLSSLILGVCYLKFKYIPFWGDYFLKIILGLSVLSLCFIATSKLSVGNSATRFLGRISYPVYLSHVPIMYALSHCLPALSSGTFILLTYTATILLSYAVQSIAQPLIEFIRNR